MKLNREGVQLNAEERNKRNQNWVAIEEEFTGIGTQIKNVINDAGEVAFDKVIDASKLEWQEPVAAFADLATTYPDATEAFTSQTTSDGSVYRFNGSEWKKIQQVDAGPINEVDTRLTAQLAETSQQVTDIAYSVKLFGAKGDGVSDDTIAIRNALNSGYRIYFPKGIYRITESVLANISSNFVVTGDNAKIIFDSPTHKEYAIKLNGYGIKFDISGISIDGNKMCNKPLEITSDAPSMNRENLSLLLLSDCSINRAKRSNLFSGGSGISVRGAFFLVNMDRVFVEDCELPQGQGASGSIGISGIAITHFGERAYIKKTIFKSVEIEKIYSSDPSWEVDQDGITCFCPFASTGGVFRSELIVENSTFTNCRGRSIKSQVFINQIDNCSFVRTEGNNSKAGNGEINLQISGGRISGCTFIYSNGFTGGSCVSLSSANTSGWTSVKVENCEVHLDDLTVLTNFFSNSSSTGEKFGRVDVASIKIYGKTKALASLRFTGPKNFSTFTDCLIQQIEAGVTGEKALIYITGHGNVTPYFGQVIIESCNYMGTDKPAVVRDTIGGNSSPSLVSAVNNIGFAETDPSKNPNTNGLKTSQVSRIGKMGPILKESISSDGYFEVKTFPIPAGTTMPIPVRNQSSTMLFINSTFNNDAFAIISSNYLKNTVINKGSVFSIGDTVEPETGTFKIWSSALNEISIKNENTSTRTFSIFEMSPA